MRDLADLETERKVICSALREIDKQIAVEMTRHNAGLIEKRRQLRLRRNKLNQQIEQFYANAVRLADEEPYGPAQ
jgi:hypothetical protein